MLTGADGSEHPTGGVEYVLSIREMIRALPFGSYPSTERAVDHVLGRSEGKLAASLAATLAHPDVASYLGNFTRSDDGAIETKPYTPFAGVLMPLLYGPHRDRSFRFFAPDRVDALAYARSAAIAQGLSHALDAERSGVHIAHYGALQWIASCAREIGHLDSFDHFVVSFHDRHVLGRSDHGHDRLERILNERESMRERSRELYAQLVNRDTKRPAVLAPVEPYGSVMNAPGIANP